LKAQKSIDEASATPVAKEGAEEAFIPTSADITSAKNVARNKKGGVNEARFLDVEGNPASINLTKFDTTDDLRKTISAMVKESPEDFGARKYTTSEVAEIADSLGMTVADVNAWSRETGLHIGQIKASAHIALDATDAFATTAKRHAEGLATDEELAIVYSKAASLVSKSTDMKSMAGLLLKEADIPVAKGKLTPQRIKEMTKVFGDDAKAAAKALNNSGLSNNVVMKAFRKIPIGKLADRITNMRHASNLSNPATHARNILGGFTNTALRPGETLVAATLNAIEKNPRGVNFSDAYHELAGMAHGFMDAISITGQKLRGKEAKFMGVDPNKAKVFQAGIDAQNLPSGKVGQAFDFMDKQIVQGKFVGDALRFEDNFVKHVNAMMTLRKEAYRKAKFMKGASADEKVAAVAKEMADPSAATLKKMYKDAEYVTLTNDLSQGIAKSLADVSTGTTIGKLVAPYAKVNLNAMMYKFERIPGINLLLKDVRANLNHRVNIDPVVRQTQVGRMAFASTTMTALGAYLHQSDAIIGSGPKDSRKYKMFEQAGYQRNSIKVGDSWIEFRRETPLGGLLGLIADGADLIDMVNGDNEQYVNDSAAVAVALVAQLYNPEYLTSVVSDLFKAMADNDVKSAQALMKASVSVGTQFVPWSGAARQYTRQMTEEGRVKREVFDPTSVINTFMNRVQDVYAPASLAVKRNILGDPIMHKTGLGPDVVSPFGVTKEINDPVIQELAKLSGADHILDPDRKIKVGETEFRSEDDFIDILMPQKSIRVAKGGVSMMRNLRLEEYEQLVLLSSGNYEGGIPLKDTLKVLFKGSEYKALSQKAKGSLVKEMIAEYHKTGREMFQGKFIDEEEIKSGLKKASQPFIK